MPLRVPIVVGRDDLRLEQIVERSRIRSVHRVHVVARRPSFDQPAVLAGVAFGPPAVADREVRDAVERRLHAARAARLHRLARVVQPDVAALHQEVRDVEIVVVHEGDPSAVRGIDRVSVDLLDVMLAGLVGRMRLAREDDLHGPAGRVEDRLQASGSWKINSGALVAGEAPREADRQRVGIEQRAGRRRRARP